MRDVNCVHLDGSRRIIGGMELGDLGSMAEGVPVGLLVCGVKMGVEVVASCCLEVGGGLDRGGFVCGGAFWTRSDWVGVFLASREGHSWVLCDGLSGGGEVSRIFKLSGSRSMSVSLSRGENLLAVIGVSSFCELFRDKDGLLRRRLDFSLTSESESCVAC